MSNFLVFVSGWIFGMGLGLSGMMNPNKILNFLDVAGNWDPSLILVMGNSLPISAWVFHTAKKRAGPLFGEEFLCPTRRDFDWRLWVGAILFGLGWGIGGFCPGPALANTAVASAATWTFLGAMFAGIFGVRVFLR